jgi:hypothetical protein
MKHMLQTNKIQRSYKPVPCKDFLIAPVFLGAAALTAESLRDLVGNRELSHGHR